ncbi:phosphoribosylformylglycinamidine synthase I [Marinitoga piezophila KA3]|uniref:Phosphoribosylformylglycinamidine synthase subunit PurQ n=1 Tax=Marinitoga piezophila (strain DSM 14283 / JCM 11233 / KA3) TaxID=443254 RepID=H2J4H0_MARPK|nr:MULTISPECIES: phosphoribosylformylglycinamidine synthase subunit PurQ [Marinitoga]AEX84825.1 phosphoribosylformylglycinamidine synthase I [Marinitoga piezophila KA3]APT75335.1 phosphoribosylformylglycinamidine synthase [Marinitoga sp. 1137]NUU97019.1 phosphoribosylformylglycinamidine synthase [Marinitoga sp. 1138]
MINAGIIVFPGSNCDRDAEFALRKAGFNTEYVWHDFKEIGKYDLIFIPGGFSYGDYLRAGALAKFSPVMNEIEKYVSKKQGFVLGICNGFQILTESGILPGALTKNTSLKFICKDVDVKVINKTCSFTKFVSKEVLRIPIAHAEGNYYISESEYIKLKQEHRIAFEYVENPNGSVGNIAGVYNENFAVLGMMPHPERNSVRTLGNGDGLEILLSIRRSIEDGKK